LTITIRNAIRIHSQGTINRRFHNHCNQNHHGRYCKPVIFRYMPLPPYVCHIVRHPTDCANAQMQAPTPHHRHASSGAYSFSSHLFSPCMGRWSRAEIVNVPAMCQPFASHVCQPCSSHFASHCPFCVPPLPNVCVRPECHSAEYSSWRLCHTRNLVQMLR
jgi:hypothetical protein